MSSSEGRRLSLSDEDRAIFRKAGFLSVCAILLVMSLGLLVHYDKVQLHPSNTTPEMLKGFSARIEYSLRFQTLYVTWLMFNVFATIHGRMRNMALNPLVESTEAPMLGLKNILTNSFEQFIISAFSQLILVSFAMPETVLRVIPLVNILQLIGRITFFIGYPKLRSFGMVCTLIPNAVMVGYNLYRLVGFMF